MPVSMSEDRHIWRNRADAAFDAMVADRLYSARGKLFGPRRWWWVGRSYEPLWPFANAWSAACTLASLDDHAGILSFLPLLFDGLAAYHRNGPDALTGSGPVGFESVVVPPLGEGGDVYFDDNAWLGLALVRHHELWNDDRSLPLARRLFDFVVSGWSDAQWSSPGGIRWKADPTNTSRNTCANGPAVALGARIHRLTGDRRALDWSLRIYGWTRAALLGPDDLYADRIDPHGTVTQDRWTYNQGSLIGGGVLLFEATGDPEYLAHAQATASASLERFDLDALLAPNGPAFNGVFFRNLFLLDRSAPNPRYRALADEYGEVMWEERRNARTGLAKDTGSLLNGSAPMVQIYALLAGAPPHP